MGQQGHTEIVRLLLQQPNIDVNKGAQGWPPLKLATHLNHTEIIQLLKNAATNEKKSTTTDDNTKNASKAKAKEEAEKIAFPNDGKPPAEVTAFIEKSGDYMTKLNNE